ncbi:helicase-exonuclease AddAB subunit AddA [Staphylococcus canis]|uniref:ATP-dependent helicase/nuclease subunit A n=1 Tax=Staphylococcus canis TaxID=2724942 RepID=A0ABS0TC13_9STAP|nr:helicase-exonuclease AddAB subunit AddA [Staphylococcus canis]MBI5975298.1 helicase-exonuclease AddAB subunit AddA [Staphylococcus canis]
MTIPTKPQNVQWTDAQWESIYAKGRDILVAAAAGSGKTAVLVERIIQRVIRDGIDVDRLLVVTFTNLSAREMKHRIEKRIQQASIENPAHQHLKNQRTKIHQAQISTLHSFCLKLIQHHYDVLDIDPNFKTANDVENTLLLEQVIDNVLEHYYEILSPEFVNLIEHISTDRDDTALRDIVKKLYYFSIANPNPKAWLKALDRPYSDPGLKQHYLKILDQYIDLYLVAAQNAIESAYQKFEHVGDYQKHITFIDGHRQFLNQLMREPEIRKATLRTYKLSRMPSEPKEVGQDEQLNTAYEAFKASYEQFKDAIQSIQKQYAARDDEDLVTELGHLAPRVSYLAQITIDVIDAFDKAKRERNILDFSDYEHFALQILKDKEGNPSEIARLYREKFEEILVDEYQDTNKVQEEIISTIKRGDESNGNLFMVGDVKQSIYKFRQADPSLFIDKYNRFDRSDSSKGWRIDLSQNFRSRKEVLSTTNYLFHHMMDPNVGEIEYDEAARLYYGAPYDERDVPLHFKVCMKDTTRDFDINEQEAYVIAEQVNDILKHYKVYDAKTGTYRAAEYKDIVILERNNSNARQLQSVFKELEIPLFVNSKQGYFEQTEIRLMLSFLRVIDNPLQDIYLVGLMRSVIYQFTEEELAKIRVVAPKAVYFYESIQSYLNDEHEESALVDKLQNFLNDIVKYQDYARHHAVYQLIDKIYNDHYIVQYFSGLAGGKGRRANLYGLFNKAVEFENSSFRGLFQFIRFIDQMIERGKDFGEENVIGPNDNVVRLMTIHKSKGLEFPFVIYSGLNRKFNMSDLGGPVVLNQHEGLGLQYYDSKNGITYPSLISMSIDLLNRKEIISEEMRLIYVALTRAKEQLFLIGTVDDEKKLTKLREMPIEHHKLSTINRLNVKNAFELIYSVLSKYLSTDLLKQYVFEGNVEQLEPSLRPNVTLNYMDIANVLPPEVDQLQHEQHTLKKLKQHVADSYNDPAIKQRIEEKLLYTYPNIDATHHASKQSVSELKRQMETEQADTNYDRVRQYQLGIATYERPTFMQEQKLTPTEIGTLMHTVMQHLPFLREGLSDDALDKYLKSLVDKAIIKPDDISYIRKSEIRHFIDSELYQTIANSDEIYRELPFIVNQDEVEQHVNLQEAAIIQGMIDLVFVKDDRYYFVDYKTDVFVRRKGMTDEEIGAKLREKYRVQMTYYQRALETILKQPVSGCLYFFKFGEIRID